MKRCRPCPLQGIATRGFSITSTIESRVLIDTRPSLHCQHHSKRMMLNRGAKMIAYARCDRQDNIIAVLTAFRILAWIAALGGHGAASAQSTAFPSIPPHLHHEKTPH